MSGAGQETREVRTRPSGIESLATTKWRAAESAEKAVLVILAGAAGAGKTTFYESKLSSVFPTILRASASPLEQGEIDQERRRLGKEGQSFVYQDVTVDPKIIHDARQAGYEVTIIYLATEDSNLNIGRVLLRVGQGGPFAAVSRIADDYARGIKQLPEAKRRADDLMLFDNTANGRGARLVAHFHGSDLVKLARSRPRWAEKVFGKEFEKWLGLEEGSRGKGR